VKKNIFSTPIFAFIFLNGQFELHRKIEEIGEEDCNLSEITIAELKYGAEKSKQKESIPLAS
jgi:tRNA(fMet)-specific endonuclease VapC